MSATTDLILERRRIRRRLTLWRVVAIVALVALAIALIPWGTGKKTSPVARIWIDGMILADPAREKKIGRIAEDDDVEALIVRINSPGGTVVASEALYDSIRAVAEAGKPVVAVMSEAAASGGYAAAIAADHVIARRTTITGSIGVYADIPNVTGLLDMMGIEVTRVKSAPLKGEPGVWTEPAPGSIAAQDALIEDTFAWFRELVSERRDLEGAALDEVTDGRAFTGRQALDLGLIDAIGDEETALAWLEEEHGVDAGDGPRDWRWDDSELPFPFFDFGDAASWFGADRAILTPGPRLYAVIQ